MKHLFLGLALAFGLMMAGPPAQVSASDSFSFTGAETYTFTGDKMGRAIPELDATVAGSAIVLLLGGVAYLASRRRKGD